MPSSMTSSLGFLEIAASSEYSSGGYSIKIVAPANGEGSIGINADTSSIGSFQAMEAGNDTSQMTLRFRKIRYCDADGTEYEMVVLCSEGIKVQSDGQGEPQGNGNP